MEKKRYLFKFYYIGKSKYYGSQRQPHLLTIEDCLIHALIEKKYINNIKESGFEAASRTDRYVSARGACFTCIMEKEPILMELNSALPSEIGIWAYARVPMDFLSRFNATLRHYLYLVPKPLSYFQNFGSLDINIMKKACKALEGQHDFINFSKREKIEVNSIRDIEFAKLSVIDDYILFQFKSRAFLRQQVRRMVKKIMELGLGEITYTNFIQLFDPTYEWSFQPVNATGLILWDIAYSDEIKLNEDRRSKERMEMIFLKKNLVARHKVQLFYLLQHDDFCE
ncbi:MAG: tRNA pseudouridine synthase A [Promethearchaeota archaeon]